MSVNNRMPADNSQPIKPNQSPPRAGIQRTPRTKKNLDERVISAKAQQALMQNMSKAESPSLHQRGKPISERKQEFMEDADAGIEQHLPENETSNSGISEKKRPFMEDTESEPHLFDATKILQVVKENKALGHTVQSPSDAMTKPGNPIKDKLPDNFEEMLAARAAKRQQTQQAPPSPEYSERDELGDVNEAIQSLKDISQPSEPYKDVYLSLSDALSRGNNPVSNKGSSPKEVQKNKTPEHEEEFPREQRVLYNTLAVMNRRRNDFLKLSPQEQKKVAEPPRALTPKEIKLYNELHIKFNKFYQQRFDKLTSPQNPIDAGIPLPRELLDKPDTTPPKTNFQYGKLPPNPET